MNDIIPLIGDILIKNDEKYQRLKKENSKLKKDIEQLYIQVNSVFADHESWCECGCGMYLYTGHIMQSGYWCLKCEKFYSNVHKDDETGDICTICNTVQ